VRGSPFNNSEWQSQKRLIFVTPAVQNPHNGLGNVLLVAVPGSLVLIGGDPGIGKSTLLLQVANGLSQNYRILYVSGEESGQQIKLRASRLGVGNSAQEDVTDNAVPSSVHNVSENGHVTIEADISLKTSSEIVTKPATSDPNLYALAETDLEEILKELESLKPHVAVIDSIQTIYFPACDRRAKSAGTFG